MVRAYAEAAIGFVTMAISIGILGLAAAIACDLVSLNLLDRLQ